MTNQVSPAHRTVCWAGFLCAPNHRRPFLGAFLEPPEVLFTKASPTTLKSLLPATRCHRRCHNYTHCRSNRRSAARQPTTTGLSFGQHAVAMCPIASQRENYLNNYYNSSNRFVSLRFCIANPFKPHRLSCPAPCFLYGYITQQSHHQPAPQTPPTISVSVSIALILAHP